MDKQVTIYSTPTCHFCNLAKEFFTENNVPYTEHNVAADIEKRQEMIEKSGQMLSPCVEINGEMLADISGDEVEAYLISQKLVTPNDRGAGAPTNSGCAHEIDEAASIQFRR